MGFGGNLSHSTSEDTQMKIFQISTACQNDSPHGPNFLWFVFYNLGSILSMEKCKSLLLSLINGQCLAE